MGRPLAPPMLDNGATMAVLGGAVLGVDSGAEGGGFTGVASGGVGRAGGGAGAAAPALLARGTLMRHVKHSVLLPTALNRMGILAPLQPLLLWYFFPVAATNTSGSVI